MNAARRASRCRSSARFRGRAPRAGLNPWSMMYSYAESSSSTAHGRSRRPRRVKAAASLVEERAHLSALEGATTIRSIRFLNSGRNECSSARVTDSGRNGSAVGSNPTPARVAIDEPMLDVRMMTHRRRSTMRPCWSVSRPSSKTCRNRSQTGRAALSNSSSRTTANGSLRIEATSGAPYVSMLVSASRRSKLRALEFAHVETDEPLGGAEQELGQCFCDLRLSGPSRADEQEDAEWAGRVADARLDHRDAFDDGVDGLSCPRTRRAKNSRVSSSRSGIEASSISSGSPLDRLRAATSPTARSRPALWWLLLPWRSGRDGGDSLATRCVGGTALQARARRAESLRSR